MDASGIRDQATVLAAAFTKNDDVKVAHALLQLGTQFLVDINRIANALEKLAQHGRH